MKPKKPRFCSRCNKHYSLPKEKICLQCSLEVEEDYEEKIKYYGAHIDIINDDYYDKEEEDVEDLLRSIEISNDVI